MVEILVGMAGSFIVFAGFGIGYALGVHSAKNAQPKVVASSGKEEVPDKITVEEQIENLMTYTGRAE